MEVYGAPTTCWTKWLREKGRFHYLGNAIIRASLLKGSPHKALRDYRALLLSSAFRPDHRTLALVLESCRKSTDLSAAMQAHARIIKTGFISDVSFTSSLFSLYVQHDRIAEVQLLFDEIPEKDSDPVYGNLMIMGLARNGNIEKAYRVFRAMPAKDLVSWNSMIGACAKRSQPKQAISVFWMMLDSGFEPDGFTFSSVLSACSRVGALGHGERVHRVMAERGGVEFNHIIASALIDMYAKCWRIEVAKKVFDAVGKDNVSVWNSMITGLAIHGLGSEVLHVFSRMELERVTPDGITFVGVLTACNHCGMVQDGRRYFDLMTTRYSIEAQLEHYGTMVDMLGRAGLLEEAYEIVRAMPMAPDGVIWRALLSACRRHRRQDLAELAIGQMAQRECGDYVLLSSVYSSVKRWHCAENVWGLMKQNRIRKGRGLSWVELGGRVHQFKAGDRLHCESDGMYRVLDGLMKRAQAEGYVPLTELVKMDVSEEEKEDNLVYHSEKLAIAFSVLKTSPGMEIRVAKNLQTCEDCHNWAKLVSKVLHRVIMLRDRLRFHRFERGSCSCGDYW